MTARLDPKAPSMKLWQTLLTRGVSEDEATELMNGYAHEMAERIRQEGAYWGQWAAAGKVYRAAADLIDPHPSAGPVRPGEEPTPPCQSPTCDMNLSACVCGTPFGKEPTT